MDFIWLTVGFGCVGPSKCVLISNSESDVCLPKSSEEENNFVPKLLSFSEKDPLELGTESPAPAGNLFPEQGKTASSSGESSSYG